MLTSFVKLRRRRRRSSKRVSFKSIEIKEKISEKYREENDVQRRNEEEYLRNKNVSIMTDNEPDFYVSKPFVGTRPSDKKRKSLNEYVIVNAEEKFVGVNNSSGEILVKSNDASGKIMDDYVIVGTEEMPVIACDNSDSESVKSMEQPLKNCSLMCNHTWYPQFKRYVLKNLRNKIYPSVVTG